jgi:hypothetical protein
MNSVPAIWLTRDTDIWHAYAVPKYVVLLPTLFWSLTTYMLFLIWMQHIQHVIYNRTLISNCVFLIICRLCSRKKDWKIKKYQERSSHKRLKNSSARTNAFISWLTLVLLYLVSLSVYQSYSCFLADPRWNVFFWILSWLTVNEFGHVIF